LEQNENLFHNSSFCFVEDCCIVEGISFGKLECCFKNESKESKFLSFELNETGCSLSFDLKNFMVGKELLLPYFG